MAYALTVSNNQFFSSGFVSDRPNIFSNIRQNEFTTTRNYTSSIAVPDDYPEINQFALIKANRLCDDIELQNRIKPSRIAASVEGGVAIVYSKNSGFLKRNHKEIFIEVYNDMDVIISYTENYKLKKMTEVTIDNESVVSDYIKEIL